ncbi:group III truncated hemoglobin [Nitrospirillum viridazoti]|uniref:Preprotein translocase subunit TatC n=1 Tax=Nitrospirillum viridazoti CBAmc TaxID=1441467 RepID=A0A248JMB7_9PROT|nr:group III truncated hemoglobin [Nitrospirillum amazonense]ASG19789.1 preprotein translocase subunit TatC [Nitrospirillum amazonense CBAmc]TWB27286.1 hemoglobin [Nitrospirillum amazonense]
MSQPFAAFTEESLTVLVRTFYDRARQDALLGPVFEGAVGTTEEAWDRHRARIVDFWSSVLLSTGRYEGRPMVVHAGLPMIGPDHFRRWLALFQETARGLFTAEAADRLAEVSARIGRSLQMGLAVARGKDAGAYLR